MVENFENSEWNTAFCACWHFAENQENLERHNTVSAKISPKIPVLVGVPIGISECSI